jgi:hypothetical protein
MNTPDTQKPVMSLEETRRGLNQLAAFFGEDDFSDRDVCLAALHHLEAGRRDRLKAPGELKAGDGDNAQIFCLPFDHSLVGPTETEREIISLFARKFSETQDPLMYAVTQSPILSNPEQKGEQV